MRDVRRRQPGIADVDGIGGDEFGLAIDAAVEVVGGRMWRHVVVELVGYAGGQEVRRVVTQMLIHIESKRCVSTDMLSVVSDVTVDNGDLQRAEEVDLKGQ